MKTVVLAVAVLLVAVYSSPVQQHDLKCCPQVSESLLLVCFFIAAAVSFKTFNYYYLALLKLVFPFNTSTSKYPSLLLNTSISKYPRIQKRCNAGGVVAMISAAGARGHATPR